MADAIADLIGDYRAFAAQQRDRLLARGIDIAPYALSHVAFRVPEWDQREVLPAVAAGLGRALRGPAIRRRVPPRRRLGPAAAGHSDRPEPLAPVTGPPAQDSLGDRDGGVLVGTGVQRRSDPSAVTPYRAATAGSPAGFGEALRWGRAVDASRKRRRHVYIVTAEAHRDVDTTVGRMEQAGSLGQSRKTEQTSESRPHTR